jgi:hypothetical protein
MSNIMNDLHAVGLNPFGVQLVAESLLKSPLAQLTTERPQAFFFPIKRSDCPGWIGARFTLQAVPEATEGEEVAQTAQASAENLDANELLASLTALLNDPAVIDAAKPGDIGRAICAVKGI